MPGSFLDPTYGAATLSSFISAALFGFTFLQTYTYFIHRSSSDSLLMKLGISLLWIVDCSQVIFIVWAVYWYLVQNFFIPSALLLVHWLVPLTWIMSGIGSFIAEGYFIPQIWALSEKNKLLTAVIALATLGQFASCTLVLIRVVDRVNTSLFATAETNWIPVILQQVCAIIGNGAITAALCFYNYKPSEGFFGGASVLDGLLDLFLDRGLLSSLSQVVYLFLYIYHHGTFLWLPFHVASAKLLVNALLARLNGREVKVRKEAAGFNLGHLGARPIMPMNEQVVVVTTKTVLETDANSISSKGDVEGQTNRAK